MYIREFASAGLDERQDALDITARPQWKTPLLESMLSARPLVQALPCDLQFSKLSSVCVALTRQEGISQRRWIMHACQVPVSAFSRAAAGATASASNVLRKLLSAL